jgi:hypothetical protein
MLRRIGVALAAVLLLLPLTVVAQKSGRSRSSSSTGNTSSKQKSISTKSAAHPTSTLKKSTVALRAPTERSSASTRSEFMKQVGYPKGRKGCVVDHIVPLECGGADTPSNMQW